MSWLPGRSPLLLTLAMVLAVAGAKFELIHHFGSDVPFGDQWYGEIACTYAPWLRGDLGLTGLFAAHNEHRIVFTRLLDLALLELNGQWDPWLQLAVNALLQLAGLAVLLRHAARQLAPIRQVILALVCMLFFSSAALWENTLNGFQSQFYFLLLFSLLHVLLTIDARPLSTTWWLGSAAGLCNLFAMAPGLLSAPAILGWLAWRRFRCGRRTPRDIYTLGWNLALLLIGWLLVPASSLAEGHGPATAAGLGEALRLILSWPVDPWPLGPVVWLPAVLFLVWNVFRKPSGTDPGWLLGLLLLALLFVLVTSIGRGGLASRYADIFSLGVVVNCLCLLVWPARRRGRIALAVAGTLWLVVILQGLWRQETVARQILHQEAALPSKRTDAIRRFFATGNDTILRQPDELFTPLDIGVIQSIRANPPLLDLLPFSIRSPLDVQVTAGTGGFLPERAPVLPNATPALPAWGTWESADTAGPAEWKSAPLQSRGALLVFLVAGEVAPPFTELFLQTADGSKIEPLQKSTAAPDLWRRVNFRNPGQPFQIIARDNSDRHWLAFSAPLENTYGSWLTGKILRNTHIGSALLVAGWTLLLGVSLAVLVAWFREDDSGPDAIPRE